MGKDVSYCHSSNGEENELWLNISRHNDSIPYECKFESAVHLTNHISYIGYQI